MVDFMFPQETSCFNVQKLLSAFLLQRLVGGLLRLLRRYRRRRRRRRRFCDIFCASSSTFTTSTSGGPRCKLAQMLNVAFLLRWLQCSRAVVCMVFVLELETFMKVRIIQLECYSASYAKI